MSDLFNKLVLRRKGTVPWEKGGGAHNDIFPTSEKGQWADFPSLNAAAMTEWLM